MSKNFKKLLNFLSKLVIKASINLLEVGMAVKKCLSDYYKLRHYFKIFNFIKYLQPNINGFLSKT